MSDSRPSTNAGAGERDAEWQGALSTDDRLDLLASSRRRAVLRYLRDCQRGPVEVGTLADHLAATGYGDRKSVEISLQHVHLPKLTSKGVVEYDAGRGHVRYRPREELEELLAFVGEE